MLTGCNRSAFFMRQTVTFRYIYTSSLDLKNRISMKQTTIVWQSNLINTTELVHVEELQDKIVVSGQILGEMDNAPVEAQYQLELKPGWVIQSVKIDWKGNEPFSHHLLKNADGHWSLPNGKVLKEFEDCEDIDIRMTPFTNTLSIRRLQLPVGEPNTMPVLYFHLPEPKISSVLQRYTNMGDGIYKYENLTSDFTSFIEVDESGYVIDYPGIWQRVLPKNPHDRQLDAQRQFSSALISNVSSDHLKLRDNIYKNLVGSWDVTAVNIVPGGEDVTQKGEWIFAWVLEGRAIQDVWIAPKRALRTKETAGPFNRYGTTIRYYHPELKTWKIFWHNPVSGAYNEMEAGLKDAEIEQTGIDKDGNHLRWIFSNIQENSFEWHAEISYDEGKSWQLEAKFSAKRK